MKNGPICCTVENVAVFILIGKTVGNETWYARSPSSVEVLKKYSFCLVSLFKELCALEDYGCWGYLIFTGSSSCIICFQVLHIFSHIHQTYIIEGVKVDEADLQIDTENLDQTRYRWVTRQQFEEAAISTAMRKVCGSWICWLHFLKTIRQKNITGIFYSFVRCL